MIIHEPYKIKSVRNITFHTLSEREQFLREAGWNVTRLPASRVAFDLVTQGTSAMSQEQVGALFCGDEAYAGARNYYHLTDAVKDVFGLTHVCPVHNRFGALKLLCSLFVSRGTVIGGNTDLPAQTITFFGGNYTTLITKKGNSFAGNIDIIHADSFLAKHKGTVPFLYIDLCGNGYQRISYQNLSDLKKLADSFKVKIVLDASSIVSYVSTLRHRDPLLSRNSILENIHDIAALAHIVIVDAGQDAMSNVGGFCATNDDRLYEKLQNEVVVYEGLHTYGGMAGRTMEVVSLGLHEMVDEQCAAWIDSQTACLAERLQKGGVPFTRGYNGVYLYTDAILPRCDRNRPHTLAAAVYLTAGIRTNPDSLHAAYDLLPVLIPRRALMNTQIEQIADAIIATCQQHANISPLIVPHDTPLDYGEDFLWNIPSLKEYRFTCEPYTIHAVEQIGITTRQQRRRAIVEAGYNTFLLKSEDVTLDFLTDSGTSAMSVDQWALYLQARETPAFSDAYYEIVKTAQEVYGHRYVILTHQGRAAEHIMSQMFITPGDYVPGNMYFTTTKLHQELAGGTFVDVIVDEAHNTSSRFPWKGNIDCDKLRLVYEKAVKEGKKIRYVSFEFNVNMAGGQPVSMQNIKEVSAFCKQRGIPVFFDATRCAENACFIQRRDQAYANVPVKDILREMLSYGDGATISSKKDMLANISGTLLFRDNKEWYSRALYLLQLLEGPRSSGGTSAGDMAAHAQGLREMINDAYINSRIEQTAYLGALLHEAGVPIVLPCGGHAIFLDARSFLPHIDQDCYPAQMLAAMIFVETGLRAMERGNVSKGRDPATGRNYRPSLELVRLTIPRRVYSRDHLKAAAEGIITLYTKRHEIGGLAFTYEPERLRFFQGRFKEVTQAIIGHIKGSIKRTHMETIK